jgi:integrase
MPSAAKPARLWLKPRSDGASFWYIKTPSGERGCHRNPGARPRGRRERPISLLDRAPRSPLRARAAAGFHPCLGRAQPLRTIGGIACLKTRGSSRARERPPRLLWHTMTLAEVNSRQCALYVAQRGSEAAARRDLEDLKAAINLHRKEGLCNAVVNITLPPKGAARERWLTTSEAARLIWAGWRYRQPQRGKETPRRSRQHIARFIIVALYGGSRSAAILDASFAREPGRGYVGLEKGLFYRLAEGETETSKRRPTICVPIRLLAHMRRWHANGARHVIEHDGRPVASVKKSFAATAAAAGLPDVTPHALRHTAVTWAMQRGVDPYSAGGYFGLTLGMIQRTYGHHHPNQPEWARRSLVPARVALRFGTVSVATNVNKQ